LKTAGENVCSAGITLCQFIQLPPWSLYCQRFAYQIEEVITYLLNQKSANSSFPVSALLINMVTNLHGCTFSRA